VTLCSLVADYKRVRGTYCLHRQVKRIILAAKEGIATCKGVQEASEPVENCGSERVYLGHSEGTAGMVKGWNLPFTFLP
jgi:hypothetical protein